MIPGQASAACPSGYSTAPSGLPICTAVRAPSVTVTVYPAIVMVPVREPAAGLFAARKVTVPFPVPEAPDFMLIHEVLLLAVQLHPAAVASAIEALNPSVAAPAGRASACRCK